ncbi:MAG: DUF934 domain-containing protein [Betaproteobacteria bacterium]|nr:MAG: DUF934 domain-containing protein [Betaproteobacteria bacterium]
MALIKDRKIICDTWRVLEADEPIPEVGDVIVPLSVWGEQSQELSERDGLTGVSLDPADDPADIGAMPTLIAVHFPVFTDGRGYSTARLLRQRYGFAGELRATGDILRDQLYELARCGFDSFLLREDQDPAEALRAFDDFSDAYQAAADRGPLFERRFRTERNAA